MIESLLKMLDSLPVGMLIIACLTLGLAPFTPPHLWEKLQLLAKGQLIRPLDWFDFLLHGTPWILLITKLVVMTRGTGKGG
ncbi:MAG: RND transporter [Desulfobulbaceae bacterium]|nr:RND transporter [Desulfobulbaceae bacterium]